MNVAMIEATEDQAIEFACFAVARLDSGALLNVTLQNEDADAALRAAFAVENLLNRTPLAAMAHVAKPGRSALLGADLVIDLRQGDNRARQVQMLKLDMSLLCPRAPLLAHQPGASLFDELEALLTRRATDCAS